MQLTYTAEWFDTPPTTMESSTLTIGTYAAHVYRMGRRGRFTWWANHTAEEFDIEFVTREIGRGRADSKEAGQQAVESAIREHHAKEPR
jgi:hypothetical protein